MASYYLTMYVKNLPVPMVYLCVAVAGFAGSYLAHAIISHIPVLRWLICGMGGKIFDIKPGDNLLVLGDEGQGLAIMKEQGLLDMLKAIRS